MIPVSEQIKIIIYYLLFGMFIGVTFDTLKLLTKKRKLYLKYILETIYWLSLIYIASLYIIKNTSHYITLYVVIIFILGIYLYYLLLSKSNKNNIYEVLPYISKFLKIMYRYLLPIELFIYIKNKINKLTKNKRRPKSND